MIRFSKLKKDEGPVAIQVVDANGELLGQSEPLLLGLKKRVHTEIGPYKISISKTTTTKPIALELRMFCAVLLGVVLMIAFVIIEEQHKSRIGVLIDNLEEKVDK